MSGGDLVMVRLVAARVSRNAVLDSRRRRAGGHLEMIRGMELLQERDLAGALALSEAAGWNQTRYDWRRFRRLAPNGCFVIRRGSSVVGTVTTARFGAVGWIGMLLVGERKRGQGLGRALLERAMAALRSDGATTLRLDATAQGQPLYERLGFVPQRVLWRWQGVPRSDSEFGGALDGHQLLERDTRQWLLTVVESLDDALQGYVRRPLWADLLSSPEVDGDVIRPPAGDAAPAVILSRPGRIGPYIGPALAHDARVGRRLLAHVLSRWCGQMVVLDVPEDDTETAAALKQMGLQPVRTLVRMACGPEIGENRSRWFLSSGPEKG